MKIGILSMQHIHNFGSFLQAFALKKIIESFGHQCEYIDIPRGKSLPGLERNLSFLAAKAIDRFMHWDILTRLKKTRALQSRWENEFLPQLGIHIHTFDHFNKVFIGSDEVFHFAQKGVPWGYSRALYGNLPDADEVYSYAASFSHTTMDDIKRYNLQDEISSDLKNIKNISVRDVHSQNMIKSLTGRDAEIHVDPVLAFDFSEYEQKCDYGDYIAIYTYPNRIRRKEEISAIKALAKEYNCKLLGVGFYFPWCDETAVVHPFEVLSIMKNARAIVTDTFHGSVMSIKYNKPFAALIRESNQEKLSGLLNSLGCAGRQLKKPENLDSLMASDFDYSETNAILANEKIRSYEYIRSCLEK